MLNQMIICIIGGIGSGKSLTAVKEIISSKQYALTNFNLKNYKNYHRIRFSDVIKKEKSDNERQKDKLVPVVNWEFWEDIRKNNKNFSIYIDEIHNLIHSRRSMSKTNILMSKWVSQIRKICQDSPSNHLYIISQTLRKIDIDFRELTQVFIRCSKVEVGSDVYIINKFYESEISMLDNKRPLHKQIYRGNQYFKYYDSTEMIKFGDADVFI